MAFTQITVTGSFQDGDGQPVQHGNVRFTPTAGMVNSTSPAEASGTTTIRRNIANGVFTSALTLAATDDAGTTPTGVTYKVEERLGQDRPTTYYIRVPAAGGAIDLSTVERLNVTDVGGVTIPVTGGPFTSANTTLTGAAVGDLLAVVGVGPVATATRIYAETVVVAASDSPARAFARYRCDGTDDQDTITAAIASVATGGRVLLLVGTYYLSAPVVIDRSWVTVEGVGSPMWGGYNSTYPTANQEASACAKLKVGASGVNGIEIHGSNAPGVDARHKGITVRNLYLYGFGRTGQGIRNGGGGYAGDATSGGLIDWCHFSGNFVHNFSLGMSIHGDTCQITDNSIQDCGGDGINATGIYTRISENLIFDIGGSGIYCRSRGAGISDNVIGHCQSFYGIGVEGPETVITGNRVRAVGADNIYVHADATGTTVTGNTTTMGVDYATNTTGAGVRVAADECAVVGNTILNDTSSAGHAVRLEGAGNVVQANVLRGTGWNSGGPKVLRGTGNTIKDNPGYVSELSGAATVSDGGTVTHGLAEVPASVRVTGSVAGETVAVTAVGSTTFTVAITDDTGAAGSTQTVYWQAELGDDTAVVGPAEITSGSVLSWLKADAVTGVSDGAALGSWTDTAEPSRAVTSSSTARPLYIASGIGSLPTVRFDGVNDYLGESSKPVATQPTTIFVVMKPAVADRTMSVFHGDGPGGDGSHSQALFMSSGGEISGYAGSVLTGPGLTANVPVIVEMVLNGGTSKIQVNGGTASTGSVGSDTYPAGLLVGAGSNLAGEWFEGDVSEVVYYTGAVSDSDRSAVRAALGAKYGITVA